LFGCNKADVFIISVSFGDHTNEVIEYNEEHNLLFPSISGYEGGGNDINTLYGVSAHPTYILIAPNKQIVEQDMFPIESTQNFINYFENHGINKSDCNPVGNNNIEGESNGLLVSNPVSNFLRIHHLNEKINQVKVFDLSGKLVINEFTNKDNIDVSQLPKGIYILSVQTGNINLHQKIYIQ